MPDAEDKLYKFFRYTLFVWLMPYIVWYFARRIVLWVYAWVTEPVTVPPPDTPAEQEEET